MHFISRLLPILIVVSGHKFSEWIIRLLLVVSFFPTETSDIIWPHWTALFWTCYPEQLKLTVARSCSYFCERYKDKSLLSTNIWTEYTSGQAMMTKHINKAMISRVTGSTRTATGGTTKQHGDGHGLHNDGEGRHDNGRHNNGKGQHNDGRYDHGDGRRKQWTT